MSERNVAAKVLVGSVYFILLLKHPWTGSANFTTGWSCTRVVSNAVLGSQCYIPSLSLMAPGKRERLSSPLVHQGIHGKINTVEDLDSYETEVDCTLVVIDKSKSQMFADCGFFKHIAKHITKRVGNDLRDSIPEGCSSYILQAWNELPSELRTLISREAISYSDVKRSIKYANMSTEEAFRLVGVENAGTMVSFETVGHIAHLNLPLERLHVKRLIAKIIMDKNKHIRTVVNKTSELQNEFRTMELELLAGEDNYVATMVCSE